MKDFPQPNLDQIELCLMKHSPPFRRASSKSCGDPDCIVRWFHILDIIQNHKRIKAENAQLREWMESVTAPLTNEKVAALAERDRRCKEMIELLRGDRNVMNGITWSTDSMASFERQGHDLGTVELPTLEALRIADELERLIAKVPFLEGMMMRKQGVES